MVESEHIEVAGDAKNLKWVPHLHSRDDDLIRLRRVSDKIRRRRRLTPQRRTHSHVLIQGRIYTCLLHAILGTSGTPWRKWGSEFTWICSGVMNVQPVLLCWRIGWTVPLPFFLRGSFPCAKDCPRRTELGKMVLGDTNTNWMVMGNSIFLKMILSSRRLFPFSCAKKQVPHFQSWFSCFASVAALRRAQPDGQGILLWDSDKSRPRNNNDNDNDFFGMVIMKMENCRLIPGE